MFHVRKLRIDFYIPDEILDNILVRLPRKSLSRFRCVSKHWNRLILDPKFNNLGSCEKIFLLGRQICRVKDICVTGDHQYLMTPHHSPFQGKQVRVGGTFNGILLLALGSINDKVDIMLYNPLTREYDKVRDLPPNLVPPPVKYAPQYPVAIGFGHDGVTQQDDLKIVTAGRVFYLKNNNNSKDAQPHSLYWNVFSVKNKSWRTLKRRMPDSQFYTYAGTFVNGSLYWIITHRDSSSFCPSALVHKYAKKLILALDVKEMMFSEIEVPDKDNIAFDVLGTIKGRLCCVTCSNMDGYPEFYKLLVMNKQGF